MKRILLILFINILGINALQASLPDGIREGNIIMGHVIADVTEEDIPYASIYIEETGDGTVSNEDGQFEFRNLAAGKYHLRVSAVGYSTSTKEVVVSKEFTTVIHFKLKVEDVQMDELVVSANRNVVSRRDAPVVVSVASMELFDAVNSLDLAKSLNYITGLRVENNCQNCGFPQVRINGLEGPYSQVLINSRPIVSALSGVYGLEQIPVNMIERVEVVRGGGSALFGANAVGGTVNIITKDPTSNSFSLTSNLACYGGDSWEQSMGANASLVSKDNTYGISARHLRFGSRHTKTRCRLQRSHGRAATTAERAGTPAETVAAAATPDTQISVCFPLDESEAAIVKQSNRRFHFP